MKIEINHVLIRTTHLKEMSQFLTQATGLKEGFRPPFNFSGTWLYSHDKPLVHLVEINSDNNGYSDYLGQQSSVAEIGLGAVDHIAFTGGNYLQLIERLRQQQIEYFERMVPLTGEYQVFAEGPDGLKLELLFKAAEISSIN
ncbi:MAG: lactoylglutathione lyase [Methylomarinum sp.]|nr:lactoylglutathione lyase [Methylomarinum sp.]